MTARDKYLRKTYGITQAQYLRMLKVCSGGCWICLKLPKPGKNLHIDHEHSSGRVRGLACWFCNKKVIGRHTSKDVDKFERVARYLRSTLDWRVL